MFWLYIIYINSMIQCNYPLRYSFLSILFIKLIALKKIYENFVLNLFLHYIHILLLWYDTKPLMSSAKPGEWLVTCELHIYLYPSISTCSEQNIDWLNTFHLHSFPLEPAPYTRGSALLGKQCTNYLLHSNTIMPLTSQNKPLNNII